MGKTAYERVREVFCEALPLQGRARDDYLAAACGEDVALREEVVSLLAEADQDDGFLETPYGAGGPPVEVTMVDGQPRQVGRFRLLDTLGSGSMGTVFEAEQDHPRRRVALKMVRQGVRSPEALRRFEREAELLGRLQHPGIAQIHEAGTVDLGLGPQPWFAMELVDGLPLTRHARENGLGVRERLALFTALCDAVHHAHQRGVIHRDLKPDNILVTAENGTGTTAATTLGAGTTHGTGNGTGRGTSRGTGFSHLTGRVKVLDFGVARATDTDLATMTLRTNPGQLVGTLPYMSPEQVAADPGAVDERSDVYALGVLLHELLVDALPFDLDAAPLPEAARIVREEEPPPLSSRDPSLRGELDTIVAKALEKDPERRYQSAAELGADVVRHLHDVPILARPASTLYQVRKFAARNRSMVAAVVVAFLALAVGLGLALRYGQRESYQRRLAEERESQALFDSYRAAVLAALLNEEPLTAQQSLDRAPEMHRGWEFDYVAARLSPVVVEHLVDSSWAEGTLGRTVDDHPLHAWSDGEALRLRDLATGQESEVPASAGEARVVALAPDASHLAAVLATEDEQQLHVWPLDGLEAASPRLSIAVPGLVRNLVLSDGARRIGYHHDDLVERRDGVTGDVIHAHVRPERPGGLAITRDGRWLAMGTRGAGTWIVDEEGEETRVQRSSALAFDPTSRHLALDGQVGLRIETPEGGPARHLGAYRDQPAALAFSADGRRLAGLSGRTADVWDLATGERLVSFENPSPSGRPGPVSLDALGENVAARGRDGVRVWSLTERAGRVLRGHPDYVYDATFSPDGRLVASGGAGSVVLLWDPDSGECLARLPAPFKVTRGLVFSEDGTTLHATGGEFLCSWDVALGAASRRDLQRDQPEVFGVQSGEWWALDSVGQSLCRDHGSAQVGVASDDGRFVVRGRFEPGLEGYRLHERGTGREVWTAVAEVGPQRKAKAPAVAVSPDGRLVATGHRDGAIRIWTVGSEADPAVLDGHTGIVYSMAFHPSGERLASVSRDGSLRLWHVERGREMLLLDDHEDYVHSARFSRDGTRLVTSSGDGTVRLWDTRPRLERRDAAREAARLREAQRPRVEALLSVCGSDGGHDVPAEAARRLREDPDLDEAGRAAALRVLLELVTAGD